jgi:signal transduction histidine kinase
MTILDLVRPEYVPELQSLLEQSNAGNGLRFDMEFLTRDGQPIWCMVATSPIRDANGVLIGGLGMLTDITERKHAEAELRRAHDELEARVAERTAELGDIMHRLEEAYVKQKRFIADASHDIRTPLTTVRAELDLMRASTRIDSTVGATLDRIAPQIIRLARLTDNLLLLATMDSEGTADRRVETHMEELVLEAIVDLSGVAREGGVSWNVSYDGVLDVACDASALKMAITNILQNALKHSPAGAVIDVELKGVDGAVAIVIRDSGAGISPEHLPFIFDRFYRGDQARSSQGTGLGLSIVKSVVEAHGGTVSVDSTLNVGTTITIVLPR